MTKEIYEEIKSLLETKEELERKEIMFTPPVDEIYLVERKYTGCIPRDEKEKLSFEEISVLRKFITGKIEKIKERLKELGYDD